LPRNEEKIKYHSANDTSFHTLRSILISITERLLKNLYFFLLYVIILSLHVYSWYYLLSLCTFAVFKPFLDSLLTQELQFNFCVSLTKDLFLILQFCLYRIKIKNEFFFILENVIFRKKLLCHQFNNKTYLTRRCVNIYFTTY